MNAAGLSPPSSGTAVSISIGRILADAAPAAGLVT
jgi:hypothetical protein